MTTLHEQKVQKSFGGFQHIFTHASACTKTDMRFSVYLPPAAKEGPVPWLMYLSGLTCTEANFTEKAGAQRYASEFGMALVAPDTSPRGLELPGEHDSYDFGSGAGFYVDATETPWSEHYRMYSYITEELFAAVTTELPLDFARCGIFGHSMGGHGALVSAFRNPDKFKSVSAFAPICHPTTVPWGKKALKGYLGADEKTWSSYDATFLAGATQFQSSVLVDQGLSDEFLVEQLRPQALESACKAAGIPFTLRMHEGYDHSYHFIASFMGDHLQHHAKLL